MIERRVGEHDVDALRSQGQLPHIGDRKNRIRAQGSLLGMCDFAQGEINPQQTTVSRTPRQDLVGAVRLFKQIRLEKSSGVCACGPPIEESEIDGSLLLRHQRIQIPGR